LSRFLHEENEEGVTGGGRPQGEPEPRLVASLGKPRKRKRKKTKTTPKNTSIKVVNRVGGWEVVNLRKLIKTWRNLGEIVNLGKILGLS